MFIRRPPHWRAVATHQTPPCALQYSPFALSIVHHPRSSPREYSPTRHLHFDPEPRCRRLRLVGPQRRHRGRSARIADGFRRARRKPFRYRHQRDATDTTPQHQPPQHQPPRRPSLQQRPPPGRLNRRSCRPRPNKSPAGRRHRSSRCSSSPSANGKETSFTSRLVAAPDGFHYIVAGSRVLLWRLTDDRARARVP